MARHFLQTFFATLGATTIVLTTFAFAQSQNIQTVSQNDEAVYTYHGGLLAPPPQSDLMPASSIVTSETIVQTSSGPSIAYPDSDLREPVSLEGDTVSSHEAALVTTKKTYDSKGKLIGASHIDHVNGTRQ